MKSFNHVLPAKAKQSLKKFGRDLKNARLRRRISTRLMSERAFISRPTLNKVEKGDPTVSMGAYISVLFVLGLLESVSNLADLTQDSVGRALEESQLPQRIRYG